MKSASALKQRNVHSRQTCIRVRCTAQAVPNPSRRVAFGSAAALAATLVFQNSSWAAGGGDANAVGSYLPSAGIKDYVRFTPAKDKTPALRAGTIRPDEPYTFVLPPGFKEVRISNTQNGNFCQPRCAEPWTEVVYEDSRIGKIQLMAVPLLKLTNKKEATIEQLGTPEQLLPRVASYITGTYFDEDSLVSQSTKAQGDGRQYYQYELNALDATNGPRSITIATAKGEVVYLFVLSSSEKQWKTAESTLRDVAESFRA